MDRIRAASGAAALRDFFAAVDARDLQRASASIARHFGMPLDPATDWTEVEYDFNRLFVGPAAIPAPPYASAYQEEPALMGAPALEVRDAYRRLGLQVPDQGATPDDHIAFELDAVAAMLGAEGTDKDLAELQTWFVEEHMCGWLPEFTAAVMKQPDVSGPVGMAVEALSAWLEAVRSEKEPNDRQRQPSTQN